MQATIVKIGNSQGIRIPKSLLRTSGLSGSVELKTKKGEIKIVPSKPRANSEALLSEKSLNDWANPQEEEAWKNLQ
ncbi:MAG TPA: AbrB/MazE/SpoVT family DNA-binding domain-containing protein [Candidatus Saccharibacteria bacterium]|jgi:antitoxin component of MazEF toxin-antitoxin module|nr:AbrB/MazE/SpoVT family DNA-binding domain-containing protein [Candidatus Saccharibacteria bacterium]